MNTASEAMGFASLYPSYDSSLFRCDPYRLERSAELVECFVSYDKRWLVFFHPEPERVKRA
jgi:hypothetical protein